MGGGKKAGGRREPTGIPGLGGLACGGQRVVQTGAGSDGELCCAGVVWQLPGRSEEGERVTVVAGHRAGYVRGFELQCRERDSRRRNRVPGGSPSRPPANRIRPKRLSSAGYQYSSRIEVSLRWYDSVDGPYYTLLQTRPVYGFDALVISSISSEKPHYGCSHTHKNGRLPAACRLVIAGRVGTVSARQSLTARNRCPVRNQPGAVCSSAPRSVPVVVGQRGPFRAVGRRCRRGCRRFRLIQSTNVLGCSRRLAARPAPSLPSREWGESGVGSTPHQRSVVG